MEVVVVADIVVPGFACRIRLAASKAFASSVGQYR